jgi:glucose/mannose-6-phosphate isomerase
MGGSATVGDLLATWLEPLGLDIMVVKDYALPPMAGKGTLVMAVSASGNTKETLTAAMAALKRGLPLITLSSGGRLAELALAHRVPHIRVRQLMAPRASLPALFYPAARALIGLGLVKGAGVQQDLADSIEALRQLGSELPPTVEENPAKRLALALNNKVPVIYPSRLTAPAAFRFKAALNENAKLHALVDPLPEALHNGVVPWGHVDGRFTPLLVRSGAEPAHLQDSFAALKDVFNATDTPFEECYGRGRGLLAQLLTLIYWLDYTSIYLAVLRGEDPLPILNIERVKKRLGTPPSHRAVGQEADRG